MSSLLRNMVLLKNFVDIVSFAPVIFAEVVVCGACDHLNQKCTDQR